MLGIVFEQTGQAFEIRLDVHVSAERGVPAAGLRRTSFHSGHFDALPVPGLCLYFPSNMLSVNDIPCLKIAIFLIFSQNSEEKSNVNLVDISARLLILAIRKGPAGRGYEEMKILPRYKNDIVIFDMEGEIKRSDITDVTLHQLVKEQLDSGKRKILLNFDRVEFIDSFGVGEILASYISTHNLGGKLKLVKISKKLFLIFQVTMLTKVLDIFEDEEAAMKSFF
jgi:anti-sigma B factor antagonist